METKEDNEYILKTYEDKKDARDMDMGMENLISSSEHSSPWIPT